MSLFSELQRRNVIRVAAAYLAGVWLVLQVADIVLDGFESPAWVMRVLLISAALGFPLALILAWFYELTPEGVRDAESEPIEPTRFLGRKIDFVIIGVLLLAVVFLVVDNYLPERSPNENSIAVLPFLDLSAARDQEYFSHGISEELINLLTRVEGLRVVARTSAFSVAGGGSTVSEIAAALGVRYLLEGSVRRDGSKVRITAQLIDAEHESHMWSENYDREMLDIFAIQDEVAAAIIEKLPVTLAGGAPERGEPTNSTEAYALFLRAKNHLNNFRGREAMAAADEAINKDPEFAEAYELRATIYWTFAGDVLSAADAQERMGVEAGRALEHDRELVLAQAMNVAGNLDDYSFVAELSAYKRAAEAEPNNAAVLEPLVFNLRKAGYLGEALDYSRRLLAVDPYSTVAHGRLQSSLMACRRTDDAVADIGGELAVRLSTARRDSASASGRVGTFDDDDWFVGEIALLNEQDDLAIDLFSARLDAENIDSSWIGDLVRGARDAQSGEAYLDARIPEIIAATRSGAARLAQNDVQALWLTRRLSRLYLLLGFLDRYYDIIWESGGVSDSQWPNAEDLIAAGMAYPEAGFTSHPRYLETATALGIVDAWEVHGAPDYCQRQSDNWTCAALAEPCGD